MQPVNHIAPLSATPTDIKLRHPLVSRLPQWFLPFALISRWDRPVGVWLMLLPALWGLVLASSALPHWSYLLLFFIGAWAMRGAGCTINDILDRKLDAQVARTALRPLAAGTVSPKAAWVWLAVQLLIALIILFRLPPMAQILGWAAVPLVLLYPLMKRITWWPQMWLGLTFNWGFWIGAAVHTMPHTLNYFLFYIGAIFWTVGYDTIYAVQDRADDSAIGVKSTARLFGRYTRQIVYAFYGAALGLWLVAGLLSPLNIFYVLGWLMATATSFWILRQWREDDMLSCRTAFIRNQWVGLILLAAIMASSW